MMDDHLERARRELRAAERDFECSVRWLGWAVLVCALSWGDLMTQRLHWLPIGITVPLAGVLLLVGLVFLAVALRLVWTKRPWPRRRRPR